MGVMSIVSNNLGNWEEGKNLTSIYFLKMEFSSFPNVTKTISFSFLRKVTKTIGLIIIWKGVPNLLLESLSSFPPSSAKVLKRVLGTLVVFFFLPSSLESLESPLH